MIKYNKHYNPKNKYIEKNILFEIYYDIDEDDINDVVFNSRYDVSDYDTFADLY